jgi:hypothetical protein
MVFVQTTFAIHTVEGADLTVGRHEVDAERDTQPAAVYRPEDGRWIDNRTHTGCKITYLKQKKKKRKQKIWKSL